MSDSGGDQPGLMRRSLRKVKRAGKAGGRELGKQLNRLRDQHICLGITGLSQSGKTTFITSLINQLMQHKNASLPGFSPVLGQRLLGVIMHPLGDADLLTFPYDSAYRAIAEPEPRWPQSTRDVSGCLLELRLAAKPSLNPLAADYFSLYVEIRDYPGEWLLDLPLREMDFGRWCQQCQAQYQQSPRRELLASLFDELQQLDPLASADDSVLEDLQWRFVDFLRACKNGEQSLSLIQPGRFLIPGQLDDESVLQFVPLLGLSGLTDEQLQTAAPDSYLRVCEQRYQRYVRELVEPFYRDYFSRIDRQLVLIDVVSALNAGPGYVDDLRQALTNITDSFAYGSQSRLWQWLRPKVDRVVFVASKIDQVLAEDHEAVRQLLGVIVQQAYQNAAHEGVMPLCEATAAVRSSQEIDVPGGPSDRGIAERSIAERGIAGRTLTGDKIGYVHPKIPGRLPEGDGWQVFIDWHMPELQPPVGISYRNSDAIPHIRLDTVLNSLIGDKCQ